MWLPPRDTPFIGGGTCHGTTGKQRTHGGSSHFNPKKGAEFTSLFSSSLCLTFNVADKNQTKTMLGVNFKFWQLQLNYSGNKKERFLKWKLTRGCREDGRVEGSGQGLVRGERGVFAREMGDVDNGNIRGCRKLIQDRAACRAPCLTYMLLIKVKIKTGAGDRNGLLQEKATGRRNVNNRDSPNYSNQTELELIG